MYRAQTVTSIAACLHLTAPFHPAVIELALPSGARLSSPFGKKIALNLHQHCFFWQRLVMNLTQAYFRNVSAAQRNKLCDLQQLKFVIMWYRIQRIVSFSKINGVKLILALPRTQNSGFPAFYRSQNSKLLRTDVFGLQIPKESIHAENELINKTTDRRSALQWVILCQRQKDKTNRCQGINIKYIHEHTEIFKIYYYGWHF